MTNIELFLESKGYSLKKSTYRTVSTEKKIKELTASIEVAEKHLKFMKDNDVLKKLKAALELSKDKELESIYYNDKYDYMRENLIQNLDTDERRYRQESRFKVTLEDEVKNSKKEIKDLEKNQIKIDSFTKEEWIAFFDKINKA